VRCDRWYTNKMTDMMLSRATAASCLIGRLHVHVLVDMILEFLPMLPYDDTSDDAVDDAVDDLILLDVVSASCAEEKKRIDAWQAQIRNNYSNPPKPPWYPSLLLLLGYQTCKLGDWDEHVANEEDVEMWQEE
jgi:hypothetical protein